MMKSSLIAAAAYVAAAMTANAQTVPATAPEQHGSTDQPQIDRGKGIFAHNCSHCHGPNMVNSGTVAPDLRRFPDDRERFFSSVKQGKNGKMPPWGDLLSDDQIADLWAFMSSRRNP